MTGQVDDFSTYQGAYNIFSKVNCVGNTENCIFGAIVDMSKSASFTGSMIGEGAFGAAGYVIGGLLGQERDERVGRIYDYLFALINLTEYGVGIMPLTGSGGLRFNPANQTPCYDAFIFYRYQELSDISVKKYYGIRKSVRAITLTLVDGNKLHFNANMVEKTLPYQENGMNAMVNKYGK